MVGEVVDCALTFSDGYFIMNFQKIKNKSGVTVFLVYLEGAGTINPHSSNIQKPPLLELREELCLTSWKYGFGLQELEVELLLALKTQQNSLFKTA